MHIPVFEAADIRVVDDWHIDYCQRAKVRFWRWSYPSLECVYGWFEPVAESSCDLCKASWNFEWKWGGRNAFAIEDIGSKENSKLSEEKRDFERKSSTCWGHIPFFELAAWLTPVSRDNTANWAKSQTTCLEPSRRKKERNRVIHERYPLPADQKASSHDWICKRFLRSIQITRLRAKQDERRMHGRACGNHRS